MKFVIGYSVWNKRDMLSWLLDGIHDTFSPDNTEVVFHFDACTDESDRVFDSLADTWLVRRGWKPEQIHKLVSHEEVRELGGHNKIMQWFMEHQPIDFCIVAHDDQRLTADIRPHLAALKERYGDRLGLIGGRDGYGAGYSQFTGSFWSESTVQRRVALGEFVALPYQNSGPNVYTAHLIGKVGYLDPEFKAYYVWDDYGHRAMQQGFVNGVMGMDLIHRKFGICKATEWVDWSGHDMARRQMKHGF